MPGRFRVVLILALGAALCGACNALPAAGGEQKAIDVAWQDFEPLTSSRNRANWDIKQVSRVTGNQVSQLYGGVNPFYCVAARRTGKFPDNQTLDANKTYWQVHFYPKDATPLPRTRLSPTEPPAIPEPNLRDARYLIDPNDFHIVARAYGCVVY